MEILSVWTEVADSVFKKADNHEQHPCGNCLEHRIEGNSCRQSFDVDEVVEASKLYGRKCNLRRPYEDNKGLVPGLKDY